MNRITHAIVFLFAIYGFADFTNNLIFGKGIFGFLSHKERNSKFFEACLEQAESGNAGDMYFLGMMYWNGIGVKRNNDKASFWFNEAAKKGSPDAQSRVADLYYYGIGINKDIDQAVKWYTEAAKNGNSDAQFKIGLVYYRDLK